MQYVLWSSKGRRVLIVMPVHDELNLYQYFMPYLTGRPTHLRYILPRPKTWEGAMYASLDVLGLVYLLLQDQWYM